ncbi:MAG TPA: hypothetical protein VM327_06620 [Candidatus Thermoplasmatota archaeon]|nr:hypothetical protein [Candidatus Thermoplasmatota archaeon]
MPKTGAKKGSKTKGKSPRRLAAEAAPATRPPVVPKTPTPGRLGDDIPFAGGPAPKLSREPMTLIVARTDIVGGGVRIKSTGPSAVRVAKGQVVHVKHAYRLQEHSPEKEEYRFLLKSKLAGREQTPKLARLGDQWGVPEDISGYLQHEYTLAQPGRHVLEFEVGSEYCVMDWGGTTVQNLDRKDLAGKIDIIVG